MNKLQKIVELSKKSNKLYFQARTAHQNAIDLAEALSIEDFEKVGDKDGNNNAWDNLDRFKYEVRYEMTPNWAI